METTFGQLKTRHRLNMTHHRNAINRIASFSAGLLAFARQTKRHSLHLSNKELASSPTLL